MTWHRSCDICSNILLSPHCRSSLAILQYKGVWHRTLASSTPDMETWSTGTKLGNTFQNRFDIKIKHNAFQFISPALSCRQFFFVQSSQSCWVIIVPHGLWHNCTIVWLKRTSSGSQPIFPAYQAESFISGWGSSRGHRMQIMVNITNITWSINTTETGTDEVNAESCSFWQICPNQRCKCTDGLNLYLALASLTTFREVQQKCVAYCELMGI